MKTISAGVFKTIIRGLGDLQRSLLIHRNQDFWRKKCLFRASWAAIFEDKFKFAWVLRAFLVILK